MKKLLHIAFIISTIVLVLTGFAKAQNVTVAGALSGNGSYATLAAAFTAVNSGVQTGANISITIIGNTAEPLGGAILNEGAWNTTTIVPAGARTVTGLFLNPGSPIIDLNGADRVTIDGLNSSGNSLTITNNTISDFSGTSTIRFRSDASNNKITRCTILGSSQTPAGFEGGNILFSTGTTNGNDNNVVSFCNIGPVGTNRPTQGIASRGSTSTAASNNSGDTIRNCNIYNYFNTTDNSAGIYAASGSTDFVIKDNRFYQTDTAKVIGGISSQHSAIWIDNSSGNNFQVTGNIIGYSSSSGTGKYIFIGTSTSIFIPVYLIAGTSVTSSIQGNSIVSLNASASAVSYAPLQCIYAEAGSFLISGNTIGSLSAVSDITYNSNDFSLGDVHGIYTRGTSICVISNNNIGGITTSNLNSGPSNIFGIRNTSSGQWTCQNNTIGGTIANSIQSTSAATSNVVNGILNEGSGNSVITGNILKNLTSAGGTSFSSFVAIAGITVKANGGQQTVTGNTIHSLTHLNVSQSNNSAGIYFSNTAGGNLIDKNFVHSFSVNSASARLYGIVAAGGVSTFQNNMIRLGITPAGTGLNPGCEINGFYELGGTNSIFFNSVYIGGNPTSGSLSSYAFRSQVTSTARSYYNNIFFNGRSNSGASGKHYAVSLPGSGPLPAGLSCNYNDLYVNGTGTVLGLYNSTDRTTLASWQSATGKDSNSINADPKFVNQTGSSSNLDLHINTTMASAVDKAGFTIASVTDDFDGQLRASLTPVDMGADAFISTLVNVSGALTGNGSYLNLTEAFTAINGGVQTSANISVTIIGNIDEPATGAVLNEGTWNTLTISPSGGAARTVTGVVTAGLALIDLNGADRVTINGLNTGGNSLTFTNTTVSSTAGTSTIRLRNDASGNLITNCTVLGSSTTALANAGGNILFSTGTITGNDNNVVSFCNLGPAGLNFPTKCVSSNGSTSSESLFNSNDTIRNCNFYDYFGATSQSSGVFWGTGTTANSIRDNKFYQTTAKTFVSAAAHSAIFLSATAGNNFLISGNTIGYSSSNGTGFYTLTGVAGTVFQPISLNVGTTGTTIVQGNTIARLSMSGAQSGDGTNAPLRVINISGGLTSITGNTIGSQSELGNINYSSSNASSSAVFGIYNYGTSDMTTNSNNIGGITTSNSAAGGSRIWGIRHTSPGFWTCQNNIVGGTVANSINSTTDNSASFVFGISSGSTSGSGGANISGNIVRNLTSAGGTTFVGSPAGIAVNVLNTPHTISQNTIHSLSNTNTTQTVSVTGIYFGCTAAGNLVERNFIHSLDAVSPNAAINGIQTADGSTNFQNNMLRIGINSSGTGVNTGCAINGINETSGTNNFSYNSVYIGGSPASGAINTFAFKSSVTSNARRYYNNIFFNGRSNNGSTGKHYAISVGGTSPLPSGLQCNYNDLFADGIGNVLGLFNSVDRTTLASWQSATGKDTNSISADPKFKNRNGTSSTVDLHIDTAQSPPVSYAGIPIAGITNDFDNDTRNISYPDIGADEFSYTPISMTLNLTMFIEGHYNASTDSQVADTLKVYLRNTTSPFTLRDSSKSLVSSGGTAAFLFSNAPDGTYYLVLEHRNSIETWSAGGVSMTRISPTSYNFSIASAQSYGSNMKQVDASPVRFAVFSGDVNQDGTVDATDVSTVDNDASNFVSGYVVTDLTGDDFVDGTDFAIADNNAANFVSVVRP